MSPPCGCLSAVKGEFRTSQSSGENQGPEDGHAVRMVASLIRVPGKYVPESPRQGEGVPRHPHSPSLMVMSLPILPWQFLGSWPCGPGMRPVLRWTGGDRSRACLPTSWQAGEGARVLGGYRLHPPHCRRLTHPDMAGQEAGEEVECSRNAWVVGGAIGLCAATLGILLKEGHPWDSHTLDGAVWAS